MTSPPGHISLLVITTMPRKLGIVKNEYQSNGVGANFRNGEVQRLNRLSLQLLISFERPKPKILDSEA